MAQKWSAAAQFLDPASLAQPFEEAVRLRTQTPSPTAEAHQQQPRTLSYSSAGLSTRELQALARSSSYFPSSSSQYDFRTTAYEGSPVTKDELALQPPPKLITERPLDAIRRQSVSYDTLPVPHAPHRTQAPATDALFGLDIRDPWGWSFRDQTPYDALLPTGQVTSRPLSQARRSSTPSLMSSPAASSATTSSVSSLYGPPTPGAAYSNEPGTLGRKAYSSMGDVASLVSAPAPQPIPIGRSRMNNEIQYEPDAEVKGVKSKKGSTGWLFNRPSQKGKGTELATVNGKSTRNGPDPPGLRSNQQDSGAEPVKGRPKAALPIPKIARRKSRTPSPNATPRMPSPSQPALSQSRERAGDHRDRSSVLGRGMVKSSSHESRLPTRPSDSGTLRDANAYRSPSPSLKNAARTSRPISPSHARSNGPPSSRATDPRLAHRASRDLLYVTPGADAVRGSPDLPFMEKQKTPTGQHPRQMPAALPQAPAFARSASYDKPMPPLPPTSPTKKKSYDTLR